MKEIIKKHIIVILFSIAGAIGGFLYWKFIGCKTGTCLIKSVWYMTTLWGLLVGYLLGGILKDFIDKRKKIKD